MSPLISPSTWISPLEVTLPVIVRSSPIIDGTILPALGRGLLEAKVAGTGAFGSPTPSTNLVTLAPDSGFVVNIVVPPHNKLRRSASELTGAGYATLTPTLSHYQGLSRSFPRGQAPRLLPKTI